MEHSKMSKKELLRKIDELEMLNRELLREKESETKLDFAWTGNLGHWYWNIISNTVVFNPLKIIVLGYTMDELPESVGYRFFTDRLHPEDHDATMEAMTAHLRGERKVYEAEYRIQAKDGSFKWFHDRGKITQWNQDGSPAFVAGIVFDITEKKEREEALERSNENLRVTVDTDALTGIRNRKAIMGELESRVIQASINKTPLTVIMLDIDHFKRVNDTRGHMFGDKVLKEVAGILAHTLRGLDTVGRYGGEEFLVILPNTDADNAIAVAERMRMNIEKFDFGDGFHVTISGGAKEYKGEDETELIDAADQNLYAAKNKGRNQIVG
ncbi:MAG: GGDEF domain-containing protein [Firmicutes bacterium HGW-Firmicutes-11]|jgi:diguanylate cyclase (GGDEF)-like protein/PAS domain S-box-containing protein|nr:MAG: GGDEF domain-containing protein [Firmicutes bacterium HGW-Firmicutes-11]